MGSGWIARAAGAGSACLAVCILILTAACGSTESGSESDLQIPDSPPDSPGTAAPQLSDLQDILSAELDRLDIDPGRTVRRAPSGAENSVFDLQVSYYDLQSGAVLQWTERIIGDYDMNGVVNASDLTPLAQRWKRSVDYREPDDAGGVSWWPVGNPRNGGLAGVVNGVPGFNTPADHWRSARVDGDANGELNIGDITPIASHWQHSADSYRVYRRDPGETEFSLLESSPGSGYSLLRSELFPAGTSSPDNAWAFRLHFADLGISEGEFEYYIAAYDRSSGTEGAASNPVSISFDPLQEPPPPDPGNMAPLAMFTMAPETGDAPLAVSFDASGSTDEDGSIALYLWDWDGDGNIDESTAASPQALHVYDEPGFYLPQLTVWDDLNAVSSMTAPEPVSVSASGLLPPQLSLDVSPATGQRPLQVVFSPDVQSPAGTEGLLYAWDFNADNIVDSTDPPGPAGLSMTYDLPGLQLAKLRITDSRGLSAVATVQIDVLGNGDPLAALSADVTAGYEDLTVNFDASASMDPDGDLLGYRWDLDGDGEFEIDTAEDPQLQHIFTEPGSYVIGLLATDPAGASGVDLLTVTVEEFSNLSPVAVAAADVTRWGAPALITFTSSGSHDPDGPPLAEFHWDFDNDGTLDESTSSHTVEHTYAEPGFYTARLLVSDQHGYTDEAFVEIEAVDNAPPVAAFTASPESGNLPLEVLFDASASSDPDGDPLSYHWEFNIEGHSEFATTGSVTELHTYLSAGVHTCGLEVRDGLGGSAQATASVTASGPGWQVVKVDEGRPTSWVPEINLTVIEGQPAIAYGIRGEFSSLDGSVLFLRSNDSAGLSWPEPMVMESVSQTGYQGRGVCLSPNAGRPALSWVRDNGDVMFRMSMFDSGTQWFDPVVVDSPLGLTLAAEHLDVNGAPALAAVYGQSALNYWRSSDPAGMAWPEPEFLALLGGRGNWHKPELALADGMPALTYISETGYDCTIFYRHALDATGSSWSDPRQLGHIEGNFSGSSLIVIDNLPLVAYYGEHGLMFRSAQDSQGTSWNDAQVLAGYDYFDSPWVYEQLSMKDFDGVPAILDIHMGLWIADDAAGAAWNEPIHVPDGYTGSTFQHHLVDGHPAIAFQQDYLYFAIRLD